MLIQNMTELNYMTRMVGEADALHAAFERHPDMGHARTDVRGRFTYSDDTIRYWTGFSEDELLSIRLGDIVVVGDRKRANAALEEVMSSHVPTAALFRIIVKDFSEREICLAIAPIMHGPTAIGASIVATTVLAG